MSRADKQREADHAGYHCLLDSLHRLGLITGREGPIVITDTDLAVCFLAGVRERLSELSEQISRQQWHELQADIQRHLEELGDAT
jgi:hypothetical protein